MGMLDSERGIALPESGGRSPARAGPASVTFDAALASLEAQRWTRRALAWGGALFIVAIGGLAAFDTYRGYRAVVDATGRELETQARIIAEQTARTLQAVDVVLRHVAQQFREGKLATLGEKELRDYLDQQAVGLVQIEGIGLRDASGDLIANSYTGATRAAMENLADRPYFRALRDDATLGLHVGNAVKSRVSGNWVVPIVRRLETANGAFAGAVAGPGRVEYFQSFYRDIQLDPGTKTTLMHRNGTLLARYPPAEEALGKHFPLLDELVAARGAGRMGPTRTVSPVDGIERFGATHAVPDYPLEIIVTRDAAAALAPWREQALGTALRTVALGLMAGLLLALAMRQLSRVYASREALRQSQERYQLAVAGSNEGLWDWDLAHDEVFLSPRAQALMGLDPGAPLRPRREWIALSRYHPDDERQVRSALRAHLRGQTPHFEIEYRLQRPGGGWRWYRQRGVALRDAVGHPYRLAGSMEDITDRKDAERERDRLESKLRQAQKLEAMGTLAGGIAHDFNNILAAILGHGELAQREAAPGSALRRHVDAALVAGLRAKSLVERILAFSRSGMGERVSVSVQAVVGEALDHLLPSVPTGVRLLRDLAAGEATVIGDPTQIHQVVMNLCTNALHAMSGQGTLDVQLAVVVIDDARVLTTSTLPAGRYVRLVVRDTGCGIAPAVLERIFDPFFTTRGVGTGTGLGLSLVHGIVTELGGGIDVASQVGHGATFTAYLPSRGDAAPAAAVAADLPQGAGETIMLVDDEVTLVHVGEEMLAALGYEPVGFTSSVAALQAFEAEPHRFDAILSDEAMPELAGSELARRIRRLRPELPILLMTGYMTTHDVQRARRAGVADVLAKPLASHDIARALRGVLSR